MKPSEIISKYGIDFSKYYTSQAETQYSINPYLDKDCVIAYKKGFIGFVMIIKSVRNHFAYIGIQKGIYLGGMEYIFRRCRLKQALKLLGEDYIILNEKEMDRVKDKTILEGLETSDY